MISVAMTHPATRGVIHASKPWMVMRTSMTSHYLVACDFDQTLSFNDSGIVLSELIGASSFQQKVAGLAGTHLVQQGAELAYLLRHDPEFRCVREAHLVEAGARVRLKEDVKRFVEVLTEGVDGCDFSFYGSRRRPEWSWSPPCMASCALAMFTGRSSSTTAPRAKSARSPGSRLVTARSPFWRSSKTSSVEESRCLLGEPLAVSKGAAHPAAVGAPRRKVY